MWNTRRHSERDHRNSGILDIFRQRTATRHRHDHVGETAPVAARNELDEHRLGPPVAERGNEMDYLDAAIPHKSAGGRVP